jgi:hypothetical protein
MVLAVEKSDANTAIIEITYSQYMRDKFDRSGLSRAEICKNMVISGTTYDRIMNDDIDEPDIWTVMKGIVYFKEEPIDALFVIHISVERLSGSRKHKLFTQFILTPGECDVNEFLAIMDERGFRPKGYISQYK